MKIYLAGQYGRRENLFHWLPCVVFFKTPDELFSCFECGYLQAVGDAGV
jgi:hypothetical protein